MDGIIITSGVILGVIAIIEIINLFTDLHKNDSPACLSVLPVFSEDALFDSRLEYLMRKGCGRQRIIFVDFSANKRQTDLCRSFIHNNPDAVFLDSSEMQNFFSEIFAIEKKI